MSMSPVRTRWLDNGAATRERWQALITSRRACLASS